MKTIKEKIQEGYLFGCIKYNGIYNTYLMPTAYWILNYTKYDPTYDPNAWADIFREHIYIVTDEVIDRYISSIHEYRLEVAELKLIDFKEQQTFFEIYIDFDKKIYINAFEYIEMEDYLPDPNWVGKYESINIFLPKQLKTALGLN